MVVTQDKISPIDTSVDFDTLPSGNRFLHNQHELVCATFKNQVNGLTLKYYEINGEEKVIYQGNITSPLDFVYDQFTDRYFSLTYNYSGTKQTTEDNFVYPEDVTLDSYTPTTPINNTVTGSLPAVPTNEVHPNDPFIEIEGTKNFNSFRWVQNAFQSKYVDSGTTSVISGYTSDGNRNLVGVVHKNNDLGLFDNFIDYDLGQELRGWTTVGDPVGTSIATVSGTISGLTVESGFRSLSLRTPNVVGKNVYVSKTLDVPCYEGTFQVDLPKKDARQQFSLGLNNQNFTLSGAIKHVELYFNYYANEYRLISLLEASPFRSYSQGVLSGTSGLSTLKITATTTGTSGTDTLYYSYIDNISLVRSYSVYVPTADTSLDCDLKHNITNSGLIFYSYDTVERAGGGRLKNRFPLTEDAINVSLDFNSIQENTLSTTPPNGGNFNYPEQYSHIYFGLDAEIHAADDRVYWHGNGIAAFSGNKYYYSYGAYGIADYSNGYINIYHLRPTVYPSTLTGTASPATLTGVQEWKLRYAGLNTWEFLRNDSLLTTVSNLTAGGVFTSDYVTFHYTVNTNVIPIVGDYISFYTNAKFLSRVDTTGTINLSKDAGSNTIYNANVAGLDIDLGVDVDHLYVDIVGTSTPPSGTYITADNFLVSSGYTFNSVYSGVVNYNSTTVTGFTHLKDTTISGYDVTVETTPRGTFQLKEVDYRGLLVRDVFSNIDISGSDYIVTTSGDYVEEYSFSGTQTKTTTTTGYYVVSGQKVQSNGYITTAGYLPLDVETLQITASGDVLSGTLTGNSTLVSRTEDVHNESVGTAIVSSGYYFGKVALAIASGNVAYIGISGAQVYQAAYPLDTTYTGYVNSGSSPYTLTGYTVDFTPYDMHTFAYNPTRDGFLSYRQIVSSINSDEIRTLTTGTISNSDKKLFLEGVSSSSKLFYHCPDYNTIMFVDSGRNLYQYNVSDDISAFSVVNVDDYNLRAGTSDVANVTAEVINTWGDPLAGKNVTFQLIDGDGVINPPTAVSNISGVATSVYQAGAVAGPVRIEITIAD